MSVEVGKIAIFKNDDATPENRRPLFNIKFSLNDIDYEAGLWRKTDKNGSPFYSGNIKQATKLHAVPNPPAQSNTRDDDGIPF